MRLPVHRTAMIWVLVELSRAGRSVRVLTERAELNLRLTTESRPERSAALGKDVQAGNLAGEVPGAPPCESAGLGRQRRVVERGFAHLHNFGRLKPATNATPRSTPPSSPSPASAGVASTYEGPSK